MLIYKCKYKFQEINDNLISNYYICTDGVDPKLHYGIIKYNVKEGTFIIFDSNRTMLYDSRVGSLDIKALSLKVGLSNEEIDYVIAYIKPLMIIT